MKRNLVIAAGVVVVLLVGYMIVKGNKTSDVADILANVKSGPFKVEIETTGELEAKNSVKIQGPGQARNYEIWRVAIQSIVEEGKVVKKGDWVATLDRSEFQTKFNQKQIELEKANSKFVQTQLDTTLIMRESRDQLINLRYEQQEKQIILDQSKFEPPATVKQNEINRDKAKRAQEQAEENYKIKKRQNIEKMREVSAELRKVQGELDGMAKIMEQFNVIAPEDGMVIYQKDWSGKQMKAGSQVQMWDPVVATLPDLTVMMSKTYVNEVDVRRIKVGQKVDIGLDAYPDKKLSGSVVRVANVGEQRPNSDAKVFEVAVEITGSDFSLRPAMTTSNKILTSVTDKALSIPLESLHSHFDTVTFVYKKDGVRTIKQEVIVGETNTNNAVVVTGLSEGDRVYLSIPEGLDPDDEFNLLPEMNGKRKKLEEKADDKLDPKIEVPAKTEKVSSPSQK